MKNIVYAATDATFIKIDAAKFRNPPTTFVQSRKTYRRLSPEYWAWFYHKYLLMEQVLVNGKVSEATFKEILNRVAALYNLALEHHSRDVLKHAESTLDYKEYDNRLKCGSESSGETPSSKQSAKVPHLVVSR